MQAARVAKRASTPRTQPMNSHSADSLLALPVVLLAAAVISVPIARFLRLSAIVAYLGSK